MKTEKKCNGKFKTGEQCDRFVKENEIYCNTHKYFNELSEEQINKINNNEVKGCIRCPRFNFDEERKQCEVCTKYNAKLQEMKNKRKKKCKWKDWKLEDCRNCPLDETEYCALHQYVINYTEEMKEKSELCRGCNKVKYLVDGCDYCKKRAKENREKHKQNKILCKGHVKTKPCTFEAGDNGYCEKHQIQFWKNEIEKDGKSKVCSDYVRGCRNILEINSEYMNCRSCRDKDKEKDKIRRNKLNIPCIIIIDNKNEINKSNNDEIISNEDVGENISNDEIISNEDEDISNDEIISNEDEDENISNDEIILEDNILGKKINKDAKIEMKKCIMCHNYYTLDKFLTSRGLVSTKCNVICLPKERERERKRDRTGRDYKSYEQKPERKERKKQWWIDNPDKSAEYSVNYRKKEIGEKGIDEFHRKKNEYAKKHRSENPEKQKEINDKKRVNMNYKYNYYKREAVVKGREYKLTFEESKNYFLDNCYYCGYISCEGILLNGIDRKNNNQDYTLENCVSCCTMCNFMKGDKFNDIEFIKVCEHILTNLEIIKGNLCNELFKDCISMNYVKYKSSARARKKEFTLSKKEFYNIISENCYLCGKNNSDNNINGIDRIYNNIGYYFYNCKSCCSNCNYLKKEFEFYDIIIKMLDIYKIHNNKNFKIEINIINEKYLDKLKNQNLENLDCFKKIDDIYCKKQKEKYNKKKYRENLKKELGDDKYKEILRIEKAKQRGNIDDNGNIIERKKITREEKRERERLRKQKQREELRKKYGSEEFKKEKAFEEAIIRAEKKNISVSN